MISAERGSQERGARDALCPATSLADGMGTSSGSWHQCHFLEINAIVQLRTELDSRRRRDTPRRRLGKGRKKMETDF